LEEYEHRFEKEYGYLRPIVENVVDKYLDCGNPRNGFARIKCKDCGLERLLMYHTQDAEDILQIQPFASLRSLSLR